MANEGITAEEIFDYIGVKAESLDELKTDLDQK